MQSSDIPKYHPIRWHRLWDRAVEGLLPPTCVLCDAPGTLGMDLCASCMSDLPHNRHACPRCAYPLPSNPQGPTICGTCQRQPPHQDASHIPFLYQDTLPFLVVGAKYSGRLNLARLLGLCLAQSLRQKGINQPDLIIPVPLHLQRLRERGYNQALEIARALSRELTIPVDPGLCIRVRATRPQVGLESKDRQRNVLGAFGVTRPISVGHIAIVDDVVTTGSTATEVARVLREAGAAYIDLWAVARTP